MTSARAKVQARMTVAEVLDWDGGGHQGKLELVDGVVRAMLPESATHSLIQANLAALIGAHLRRRKSPCRVGTEAPVVPRLRPKDNARAADLAVTCAPPSAAKTFEEPILIVEVLSPSNEDETWESIRAYTTVPSVQEILVVASENVQAQVFRKGAGGARPEEPETVEAGGVLRLASIEAEWPIGEVYAGTHLM